MAGRAAVSVCIPAYRRARFLRPLLESIAAQSVAAHEVVLCEDCSDERPQIAAIVNEFESVLPIRYHENPRTLGYDGNVRRCIEVSSGDYCLMMGNDDLLCKGAIQAVVDTIGAAGELGVITRAYQIFNGQPDRIAQDIRHFPSKRIFQAGPEAVVALYRRTGVLSGLVFHREGAQALATTKWDGSLYYQMYLTANLLYRRNGAYIDKPLVLCRDGIPPEFGVGAAERASFTPGRYTTAARLKMFGAMVDIIRDLDDREGTHTLKPVLRDLGAYSYYLLAGHPNRPAGEFIRYYYKLGKIGVSGHPLYHAYFLSLLIFGGARSDQLIEWIRRNAGRTPNLSRVSEGSVLES